MSDKVSTSAKDMSDPLFNKEQMRRLIQSRYAMEAELVRLKCQMYRMINAAIGLVFVAGCLYGGSIVGNWLVG